MNTIIQQRLQQLEREKDITLLFACESGSRAWGFPSPDSDYDVRFIYHHPIDWYLSINDKKEDINLDIDDNLLDLSGWELRKSLRLFAKSNAAIYSWLESPIIYTKKQNFQALLTNLIPEYFNPKATIFHYLGLTKKVLSTELQKESVRLKKYFYVLRPILCAKWVATHQSPPPMLFDDLLPLIADETAINEVINDLLKQKIAANEDATILPVPAIHDFVQNLLFDITNITKNMEGKSTTRNLDPLNELFRTMVNNIHY